MLPPVQLSAVASFRPRRPHSRSRICAGLEVLGGNHRVAEHHSEFGCCTLHLGSDELTVGVGAIDAQTDQARLREIGQVEIFGQSLFPGCNFLGEGALGVVGHHENGMFNVDVGMELLAELREHLVLKHLACFKRHSGHRHKHLAVALEPHERRCAHTILNHAAGCGNYGLRSREVVEAESAAAHNALHILKHSRILGKLAPEIVAEHTFGDVVLSRTEAAGGEHHVAQLESAVYGATDFNGVVAHRLHIVDLPAVWSYMAGYFTRICICHLAEKQLVADDYD